MNSYDPTIRMNLYEKVTSLRWEAVAAGTTSSNASNVMSSFTFTISADYGSSGYDRTYKSPQPCVVGASLVSAACALSRVCAPIVIPPPESAASEHVAKTARLATCCAGAACVNGGSRRTEQRCRCECADGWLGNTCNLRLSYVRTTFYRLEPYVEGEGGKMYPLEMEQRDVESLAWVHSMTHELELIHINRVFLSCASRPGSPGSLSNRLISQLQMHHSKNLSDIASLRSTVSALNVLRPDLHRRESLSIASSRSAASALQRVPKVPELNMPLPAEISGRSFDQGHCSELLVCDEISRHLSLATPNFTSLLTYSYKSA